MIETVVIDASVAVKWVITEDGTEQALRLRERYRFVAPELLSAECANILWKKVQRGQATEVLATAGIDILLSSEIELFSMKHLAKSALTLSFQLRHPAYDCFYLSLAQEQNLRFITADARLLRVVSRLDREPAFTCLSLDEASA